ncbi:hypothetical protein I546_2572 [Mycobacterium kansasii 732]|nr:hypothetical protein I546_2572 [Mycobacterium kansasii 732]
MTLSLSDQTPPGVNGFTILLKTGSTTYQLPYLDTRSGDPKTARDTRSPGRAKLSQRGKALCASYRSGST